MSIRESLISLGELPYRRSVITLRDGELTVENCGGVISVSDCREVNGEIVLKLHDRLLRVTGSELLLESLGAYGVRILGGIQSLAFVEL